MEHGCSSQRAHGAARPGHDRKFVAALARGLEVLRAFTPTEGLLGNQEIADAHRACRRPTVSRLTYTLTKLGYLTHIERLAKYQLAPAALSLGYSALANMRIRQVARPHMQELANYAGASVALGSATGSNLIYIELAAAPSTARCCASMQGSRIPIATTAMGRALIAGMPERERTWLMATSRGGKASTGRRCEPASNARSRISRRAASRSRSANGSATSRGRCAAGAAPTARASFAFNCGAPAFHFTRERLESDIGPRLVNMVRNVEAGPERPVSRMQVGRSTADGQHARSVILSHRSAVRCRRIPRRSV